ncbi:MAG: flagellar motor protein MotB [Jatrophihabitans sp.]|uniref:flagellar motor protein MotB n=1 Tax=Jatrophihabitans sp. TaxID=1932789 RepID=UPI003F81921C
MSGGGRGHGSAVARSKQRRSGGHAEEHEEGGAERWLVTYADMLTLLLVLFIVLFSISVVNTSKFIALSQSLSNAFGNGHNSVLDGGESLLQSSTQGQGQTVVDPGQPISTLNGIGGMDSKKPQFTSGVMSELEDYRNIEKAVKDGLAKKGLTNAAMFKIDRRGLVITVLTDELVFPGNSATLLSGGSAILSAVAPSLAKDKHNVEVDGFTNQLNVSTGPYPSGWELSSARASSVVRYLIAAGVHPDRLSAVGFSDQKPLLPASDPRSVTRNRRVEIVVLTSLPAADQATLPVADQTIPAN